MAGVGGIPPSGGWSRLGGSDCAGDDGVGEVEEGIDDGGPAFVAAGEAVEGVLPGVGPFDLPPLACLDGRLLALVRDAAVQVACGQFGACLVRCVAGVQVDGDLVGQRPEVVQEVQGRGEQWGVVAVCSGQDPAERDSLTICHTRALQALFAAVDR